MRTNYCLSCLACALAALTIPATHANPFAGADLGNGRALHDSKRCAACHIDKTAHDEAGFYQRPDRKVKTLSDLQRQVGLCNSQLRLELFPDDERDIAAYLNTAFYKLDK